MNVPLKRYHKPFLIVAALLCALALTMFRDGQTGLAFRAPQTEDPEETAGEGNDLRGFRLRILSQVIIRVHERYIEPERIDQRAMLLGGLDYIQRTVAEVQVRHEDDSDDVTVQVNTAEETFSLSGLDRPWSLTFRFREVFRFIRANLRDENVDMDDIEYAACNGLLHTLDPHSVLLVPELYEEMRMGTRGEFGGLGIVISIRDGQLTIISPIDGTPASRAGLRRMDRIVMIGEETTINMTLEEAVDRLRGRPGTNVSIRIMRREWTEPRLFEITRANIRIESVESELLPGGVGYIKIRNFQGNTHEDLVEHLAGLHRRGMRSLILDLRDDPGGLLEQSVRVANTFLSEGIIVTTAGNSAAEREVRRATAANTEPDYPMVVLVNSGSASASEIVAGALKGNNRAVIIGERTFGKGSVQVLYDFPDGSALKLTIAHYLTPGDVSIQSVGIVPDIEVFPLVVRRSRVDLIPDESSLRESSLESHLAGTTETPVERPAHRIRHYRVPSEPEPAPANQEEGDGTPAGGETEGTNQDGDEQQDGEGDDEQEQPQPPPPPPVPEAEEDRNLLEDFEIRLGHDLLRRANQTDRLALIERAGSLIESRQGTEEGNMVAGLRRLDVDWTAGRDQGPSQVAVEVVARSAGEGGTVGEVNAGERLELIVRATNNGEVPVFRLHALTKSDNPYLDDRELPLGRINPGETKEWTVRVRIPRDSHTRRDPVRVEFTEGHGHAPPPQEVAITVRGLTRPTFSYAYQLVDEERGNGDGRLSLGERVRLFVSVTNQGPGQTFNSQVNIKNESGEGVLIHDGRFELGALQRDENRAHAFEIEVLPTFDENEVELELAITDFELREEVTESLHFSLVDADGPVQGVTGVVRSTERTSAYEWAGAPGHHVGWLAAGRTYAVTGARDEFLRVAVGENRSAWVQSSSVERLHADDAVEPHAFEIRMDNTPPEINFSRPPPIHVAGEHLPLVGVVTDADRVLDMYVFVGRRKVFYLSNRESEEPQRLAFDTQLPLEPGSNFVLVVARENGDVVARRIMIVRREGGPPPEEPRNADQATQETQ